MKQFLSALALALVMGLSSFAVASPAAAHVSLPATRCASAFKAWYNNPTPGNYAIANACMQAQTPGVSPVSNTSNFGFNNGFGFNPLQGFNPGFGGFIPFDGFGGVVSHCPADERIVEDTSGTVSAGSSIANPVYTCTPGLGNPYPGGCPLGERLIEFGQAGSPVWECVE